MSSVLLSPSAHSSPCTCPQNLVEYTGISSFNFLKPSPEWKSWNPGAKEFSPQTHSYSTETYIASSSSALSPSSANSNLNLPNSQNKDSEIKSDYPFYLWIHLPCGKGFKKPFKTLEEAYAEGERYVYANNTIPLSECDDEENIDVQWSLPDGKLMCSPDMHWCITICQIRNDIQSRRIPAEKLWVFLVTPRHQMIIGLNV